MRRSWVFVVALAGCQAENAGTAEDAAPADAGVDLDISVPERDSEPEKDAGPPPGMFGEPCEENRDCLSGYCVEAAEFGRICTQTCGECPEGFECNAVANAGPDRLFLCLADQPDLCKPCENDRECDDNADLCVDFGNNNYCGEDCSDDGFCPDGYECAAIGEDTDAGVAPRQCVPAGGESCQPCADGDEDGHGDGADCLGFDCDDANPDVYEGAPEVCDGRDNDCNSLVDDGLDPSTSDVQCLAAGVCRNTAPSCEDGRWRCVYAESYEDGAEMSCDGLDNDCDGALDEALLGTPAHCGACNQACELPNAAAVCDEGVCALDECEPGWVDRDGLPGNGCEFACVPSEDPTEICDLVDNDCDGRVDEGFDLERDVSHCGACNEACAVPNGAPACEDGECAVEDCEPGFHDVDGDAANGCEYACELAGDEVCNEADDDCDGAVDEDFDLAASLEHCGACDRICGFLNGVAECREGECAFVECQPGFHDVDGEPGCEYVCNRTRDGVEVCDQIDNDCDGATDEGLEQPEVCDAADNDCDGTADEDFDLAADPLHCGACNRACAVPNASPRCDAGDCGVRECLVGFFDIDGEAGNGCEYACFTQNDGLEACNAIDDDCDGATDEDFDLQNDPVNCGACGNDCALPNADTVCAEGECAFVACADGFHDLDAEPGCEYRCDRAGPEACNRADDDCDGRTDEGVLNRCGNCGPEPAEVCNGQDDDCDGTADEGVQNRCGGCGPEPAEVCDGVDNDCDGTIDDGRVCGPYVQSRCRVFFGYADNRRGPPTPSNAWDRCPAADRDWDGEVRCAGTRRDGRFAMTPLRGDVDDNDEFALMFRCDDGDNPGLADYVQRHCAVFLGYADNRQGPDNVDAWGPCPGAIRGDDGRLRCTSSGYDGRFWDMVLRGDVDENDDFGIAWICRDPGDPGRAAALQSAAQVFLAWGDRNRGNDGSATWAGCPNSDLSYSNGLGCVSSRGDGRFHRLNIGSLPAGDVDDNDRVAFSLRAR